MKQVGFWAPNSPTVWDLIENKLRGYQYQNPKYLVDKLWSEEEKHKVRLYIMSPKWKETAEYGYSLCRMCGIENGNKTITDGVWEWPEGFEHYLGPPHFVKPPQEFIDYCVARVLPNGKTKP